MGFWEANGKFWTNYVNFEGRSTRSEFWWPALLHNIIFWSVMIVLLFWVGITIDPSTGEPSQTSAIFLGGWIMLFILYNLVSFLPWMSVTVRRFHDQNMSGWMWLINLVFSAVVLVFMCIEGTKGPNKFGEHPKDYLNPDTFD